MKLLFYINSIHHGGAERVIVLLSKALKERGYDCVLVTSVVDDWEYEVGEGIKRINLDNGNSNGSFVIRNVRRIIRLRNICKTEKPSFLISFMNEPILRALTSTIGLKIINIISIRTDPSKCWTSIFSKFPFTSSTS